MFATPSLRLRTHANRQLKRHGALPALALLCAGAAGPTQAATFTPLYNFGVTDATQNFPAGQLALGRDGNFYGTMNNNRAQIFKISPDGAETVEWVSPSGSVQPETADVCYSGLTLGPGGLLYGACQQYSISGTDWDTSGIIFSYNPKLGQKGFKVLYAFAPINPNGQSVYPSPLTEGDDGNLYGVVQGVGQGSNPLGFVFKISSSGALTVLHAFGGQDANDGASPNGPLVLGTDGNFYGTTLQGGIAGQQNGGTAFQITPQGKVTILYYFPNGSVPYAGLTQGLDGNFYGTTYNGGTNSKGTVFQLTPSGAMTVLHNFDQATDKGAYPTHVLTLAPNGNLYGVLTDYNAGGLGPASLFRITTKGAYTDLYADGDVCRTNAVAANGCLLSSPLALDPNGSFYGITQQGGSEGRGVFYHLFDSLRPFVSLEVSVGGIGHTVGILGRSLGTATAVSFNGKPASFKIGGNGFIEATIPSGATTGYVTVTTPSGTFSSNVPFNVQP
jgi:uncharacterized repeat protein (TIGR03803 family)